MTRKKFRLSHSITGLAGLLVLQAILLVLLPASINEWLGLAFSLAGAVVAMYVATEAIEEVRNYRWMFVFLSVIVAEFIIFFAAEYFFLLHSSPASFPTLGSDPASLGLASIMVFVFNPLYEPADTLGRLMLFINTATSLGLAFFILQNVSQLRRLAPKND
ncbi:MAG TPA: hypothetical protein VN701_01235 [Candidatus Paceibacterota bacterium]|nr:hypothetical protein [Candidatus Paceibacterota bacterium]